MPVNNIAEIADKFTRNEIMTSNEIRQVIGMKPSDDPNADELRNKNLSQPADEREKSAESIIESRLDKAGELDSKKLKTRSKEENQNE